MFKVFKNAWKIEDLRKKILFTAFIVILFRLGSAIPVPFLDSGAVKTLFQGYQEQNNILSFFNTMAGGAMDQASIFSLSISPYINASIILQLLMVAIPAFERIMKEDSARGQKIMDRWTRIVTVILSVVLGFGYYTILRNAQGIVDTTVPEVFGAIVITAVFAAGAMIVMWLGDTITEHGVGNGISMILFAGIVARGPALVTQARFVIANNPGVTGWILVAAVAIVMLASVIFVVFVTHGERRIPVQYAKKVVGRKMYGGQNTHIPLKVNMTGVMPIIFAQSFVVLPATIMNFFPKLEKTWFNAVVEAMNVGGWVYTLLMFLMIIFFSYFYTVISFNPIEVASNLKKNGGFIMGIRPGKPTSDFITKTLNRVTLIGALFLAVIAALPSFAAMFSEDLNGFALGGTSVLIVVGVAIEIVKTLESQMLMRHYKGFLD